MPCACDACRPARARTHRWQRRHRRPLPYHRSQPGATRIFLPAAEFRWFRHGSYGIGSDSNVLIDAAQELRVLEYRRNAWTRRARNAMALGEGRSTGYALFGRVCSPGLAQLGLPIFRSPRRCCGRFLISLDLESRCSLSEPNGGRAFDSWIFAARRHARDRLRVEIRQESCIRRTAPQARRDRGSLPSID